MNRLMGWIPLVVVFGLGCGQSAPALPESEAQAASRVFARAQELENGQKTRQAMDAYHQVVRYFPNTPEARKAAERISHAQSAAVQKAAARRQR